jgi:hypothetical protein
MIYLPSWLLLSGIHFSYVTTALSFMLSRKLS